MGDLIRATGGTLAAGDARCMIKGISTDSRNLKRGDFFVPLIGKRFDGHDFLNEARQRGACGCLMVSGRKDAAGDFSVLLVPDTNKAYADIAKYYRGLFPSLSAVGVTGSNGKSTTKEMIAAVLERRFHVLKNEGTLNNLVGVPQTLLKLDADVRIAVLELGTSLPGEISRLTEVASPNVGVLTNVGPSHLEFFGDLNGVAKEKGALAQGLGAGGVYVVNADDPNAWATRARSAAKIVGFGFASQADVMACNAKADSQGRWSFDLRIAATGQSARLSLGVFGKHNVLNALAAIAVGLHYDVALEEMKDVLEHYRGLKMRMEYGVVGGITVINDAYNSNPQSFARAMDTLDEMHARKRKVMVFGDMLELGPSEQQAHELAGSRIAKSSADMLIAVGQRAAWTYDAFHDEKKSGQQGWYFEDVSSAGSFLSGILKEGDLLLLKGSRGMHLEKILGGGI